MVRARRGGLTLVEVLVVTGGILLLLALLVPALLMARDAARRTQQHHQMKEIGQAIQSQQARRHATVGPETPLDHSAPRYANLVQETQTGQHRGGEDAEPPQE